MMYVVYNMMEIIIKKTIINDSWPTINSTVGKIKPRCGEKIAVLNSKKYLGL